MCTQGQKFNTGASVEGLHLPRERTIGQVLGTSKHDKQLTCLSRMTERRNDYERQRKNRSSAARKCLKLSDLNYFFIRSQSKFSLFWLNPLGTASDEFQVTPPYFDDYSYFPNWRSMPHIILFINCPPQFNQKRT